MRSTGLLEVAARNEMVVLFPQVDDVDSEPYEHCWAAAKTSDMDHPQLIALRCMTQGLYGYDLFAGKETDFDAKLAMLYHKKAMEEKMEYMEDEDWSDKDWDKMLEKDELSH